MRITNEKLQEYQDAYKVSISMKNKLDEITNYYKILFNYENYNMNITFNMVYPSEQRIVIAHYLKTIQQCISVK